MMRNVYNSGKKCWEPYESIEPGFSITRSCGGSTTFAEKDVEWWKFSDTCLPGGHKSKGNGGVNINTRLRVITRQTLTVNGQAGVNSHSVNRSFYKLVGYVGRLEISVFFMDMCSFNSH